MTDQLTACTLSTDQARDRRALIAALRADAMIEQQPIDGGLRSRFRDEPAIEQRLRELLAAERVCCSSMRFDVGRDEQALVLDITGSPDAQPVIAAFFAEPGAA